MHIQKKSSDHNQISFFCLIILITISAYSMGRNNIDNYKGLELSCNLIFVLGIIMEMGIQRIVCRIWVSSLLRLDFVLVFVLKGGVSIGRNHAAAPHHEQHGSGQLWCLSGT
jgi:hypothetical protein